jgi:hypothetical protein
MNNIPKKRFKAPVHLRSAGITSNYTFEQAGAVMIGENQPQRGLIDSYCICLFEF